MFQFRVVSAVELEAQIGRIAVQRIEVVGSTSPLDVSDSTKQIAFAGLSDTKTEVVQQESDFAGLSFMMPAIYPKNEVKNPDKSGTGRSVE